MKKWSFVVLLFVSATILGSTVLREPIAYAAQSVSANIIGPLDGQGNVMVHEQGIAAVRAAEDQVAITQNIHDNQHASCNSDVYTVPSGQELVIEYIAAQTLTGGPGINGVDGVFVDATGTVALPLVFQEQTPGFFSASDAVHMAIPAGHVVRFHGDMSGVTDCEFAVSLGGYLQPSQ